MYKVLIYYNVCCVSICLCVCIYMFSSIRSRDAKIFKRLLLAGQRHLGTGRNNNPQCLAWWLEVCEWPLQNPLNVLSFLYVF